MIPAVRLAVADLAARPGLIVGSALLIMIPIAGFLLLDGVGRTVETDFAAVAADDLLVQESNSVGEITGSRIPASVEETLLEAGSRFAVPEIHAVAGTTIGNAVLLRGVDVDRYQAVERFDLLAGRALRPGDPGRVAMVGRDLADRRNLEVGGELSIRGRSFEVVGIISFGTYADNEAWIPLASAQEVLGWESDVSVFVIPGDGPLREGDVLPGPLSVVGRGDAFETVDEWRPIFRLTRTAAASLAAAGAIVLAVVLWRLAWLRRRDLAVLRAIGMGRRVSVVFLTIEAAAVTAAGLLAGVATAMAAGPLVRIRSYGLDAGPTYDPAVILRSVILAVVILIVAVVLAAAGIQRARPAELLRRE